MARRQREWRLKSENLDILRSDDAQKTHTTTGLGAGGAFLVEKMAYWVGCRGQRAIDLAKLEDLTREAARAQGPVAFRLHP